MFGFKKKEKAGEEFNATVSFSNYLQYDEVRNTIKVMGKGAPIPVESIQLYNLKYGNKTYNKTNVGKAALGGALFGVAGVLLAGTHEEDYLSNLTIEIKANDKFYYIPMIIGKMKMKTAKGVLTYAEKIINFLDEKVTTE